MEIYCKGVRGIIKSSLYPKKFRAKKAFKYEIILGIGGNIGGVLALRTRFERFLMKLKKDSRFNILASSIIIKNEAFGYKEQDDFLNAILFVKSSKFAPEVLKIMQYYEKIFARKRSFKNAPRTLDIDIIKFSKKTRNCPRLTLPHIGANERLSVILPMAMM